VRQHISQLKVYIVAPVLLILIFIAYILYWHFFPVTNIPIDVVLQNPLTYKGELITISGMNGGSVPLHPCVNAGPLTELVIRDPKNQSKYLLVTSTDQIPQQANDYWGEMVNIRGTVRLYKGSVGCGTASAEFWYFEASDYNYTLIQRWLQHLLNSML